MSPKSETIFRGKVDMFIKKIPESKWFSIQQLAIKGTPDKLGVIKGRFVGLELKASEDAHREPLQIFNINEINRAGGIGLFVYPENWQDVQEILLNL